MGYSELKDVTNSNGNKTDITITFDTIKIDDNYYVSNTILTESIFMERPFASLNDAMASRNELHNKFEQEKNGTV